MATVIKPGDFVEVSCPTGASPLAQIGQKLPSDLQSFVVLKLEGGTVTLGPIKAGQYTFDIPCTNGVAHVETVLTPLKKEEMPKPEGSLPFFTDAFPLWFWIAIAVILLAIAGVAWAIYRWAQRKFAKKIDDDEEEVIKVDPLAEFKNVLNTYKKLERNPAMPPPEVEKFFSESAMRLRGYLEARLSFKASWATTTEFLGQLKAATLSYAGLKDLQFQVESFLSQADLVRFSKSIPAPEGRAMAYSQLTQIFGLVEKNTTPAPSAEKS